MGTDASNIWRETADAADPFYETAAVRDMPPGGPIWVTDASPLKAPIVLRPRAKTPIPAT